MGRSSRQATVLFIFYNCEYVLQLAPQIPPSEFFLKLNRHLGRFPIQGLLKPSQPLWSNLCSNLQIIKEYILQFFSKSHRARYKWEILDPEELIDEPEAGARHCMLDALSEILSDLIWKNGGCYPLRQWLSSKYWNKEKKLQMQEYLKILTLQRQEFTVESVLDSIKSPIIPNQGPNFESYPEDYSSDYPIAVTNLLPIPHNLERSSGPYNPGPSDSNRVQGQPQQGVSILKVVLTVPKQTQRHKSALLKVPISSNPIISLQLQQAEPLRTNSVLSVPDRPGMQVGTPEGPGEIESGKNFSPANLAKLQAFKTGFRKRTTRCFLRFVAYTLVYFSVCYPILYHRSVKDADHQRRSRSSTR